MSSGSRTIGSLETYEPEDKSFSKHTLKEGTGDCLPNEGSVCIVTINLVGKYFVAFARDAHHSKVYDMIHIMILINNTDTLPIL